MMAQNKSCVKLGNLFNFKSLFRLCCSEGMRSTQVCGICFNRVLTTVPFFNVFQVLNNEPRLKCKDAK